MMTNIIDKVKTIGKAFIEPLPTGEEWYENRIGICNGCEFNSKNVPDAELSAANRLIKYNINPCPEKDFCILCSCCTHRKASQKVEACGMITKGLEPKWIALELPSKLDKKVTVINMTPDSGELLSTNEGLIFNIGETSEGRINFILEMTRKGGLDIKSVTPGCSCTTVETDKINDNTSVFTSTIVTTGFSKGRSNTRTFAIAHYTSSNKIEKIIVAIKVILK